MERNYQLADSLLTEKNYDQALSEISKLIDSPDIYFKARGYFLQNLVFKGLERYTESVESSYKAVQYFEELNDTVYVAKSYNSIAAVYYYIDDLERGKQFMKKALGHLRDNYHQRFAREIARYYHNIGAVFVSVYQESEDVADADSAVYYFAFAREFYLKSTNKLAKKGLVGLDRSLCLLYASQGDSLALVYADRASEVYRKDGDHFFLKLINLFRALYYQNIQDYDHALSYSDSCLLESPGKGINSQAFLLDVYDVRAEILTSMGKSSEALECIRKRDQLAAELTDPSQVGDINALGHEKEKLDLEKENDLLVSEHNENVYTLYLWIGLAIVLILLSLFWLFRFKRKSKTLNSSLSKAQSENLSLEEEVKHLKSEIENFAKTSNLPETRKKPSLSHQSIIEEVSKDVPGSLFDRTKEISEVFLRRLSTDYPGISRLEIRMCVYLLVGLNSKDISVIQNIEPASVDRRRYRLRKKFKLPRSVQLTDFLRDFESQLA